jgi:hypothetical protein
MWDTSGALVSGETVDCEISEGSDGTAFGTFADATNAESEIATSSGIYSLVLDPGETNSDYTIIKCTSAGAMDTVIRLVTKQKVDAWVAGITTVTSQTQLVLDSGPANNMGAGWSLTVYDNDDSNKADIPACNVTVDSYTGATKTVVLLEACGITIDAADTVSVQPRTITDQNNLPSGSN